MNKRADLHRDLTAQQSNRDKYVRDQMQLLDDGDAGVRQAAVNMLGILGVSAKQSIPRLCELLLHEEDVVLRASVLEALRKIGAKPDLVISRVLEALRGADPSLRRTAADLLFRCNVYDATRENRADRERLLPELLKIAQRSDEDVRTRWSIIELLGQWELKPKTVIPCLIDLLDDDDLGIRVAAMESIAHQYVVPSRAYAPEILQSLLSRLDEDVWNEALRFLQFLAPPADDSSAGTARSHTQSKPKDATSGDPRRDRELQADLLAAALMKGLQAEQAVIRTISASVLGDLRSHACPAVPMLCEATKDKVHLVRVVAAKSLGKLGAHAIRAVPALIEARHHRDATLRAEASAALENIAPDKYGAILLDESLDTSTPRSVTKTVVRYLGDGVCQIGEEPPIRLDEGEAKVLAELVRLKAANKRRLIEESGVSDAARVLGRIRKNHPELAEYITCPGRKGRGGYSTTIIRG